MQRGPRELCLDKRKGVYVGAPRSARGQAAVREKRDNLIDLLHSATSNACGCCVPFCFQFLCVSPVPMAVFFSLFLNVVVYVLLRYFISSILCA